LHACDSCVNPTFRKMKYSPRVDKNLDPLAADRAFFEALISANLDSLDSLLVDDFLLIDFLNGSEVEADAAGGGGIQSGEV